MQDRAYACRRVQSFKKRSENHFVRPAAYDGAIRPKKTQGFPMLNATLQLSNFRDPSRRPNLLCSDKNKTLRVYFFGALCVFKYAFSRASRRDRDCDFSKLSRSFAISALASPS